MVKSWALIIRTNTVYWSAQNLPDTINSIIVQNHATIDPKHHQTLKSSELVLVEVYGTELPHEVGGAEHDGGDDAEGQIGRAHV